MTIKQAVCILINIHERDIWYDQDIWVAISRRGDRNQWGLPGGKVEEGESLVQALVRETQEEIGLTVTEDQLKLILTDRCTSDVNDQIFEVTTYLFTGKLEVDKLKVEDGFYLDHSTTKELCDPDWSPFAEYNKLIFETIKKKCNRLMFY